MMSTDTLAEALHHHEAGELEKAAALYQAILAKTPDQADALHLLGVLTHQRGDAEAALGLLRRAIALKPETPSFHGNLGNVLQELGRSTEAIPHYEKALALDPDLAPMHYNLAVALAAGNRPNEAVPHFDAFLAHQPDHADARMAYGNALRTLGRPEEAAAQLERAIALTPDAAAAHNQLGNVLRDLHAPEKARRHYKKALLYRPDFAEAHCNLGEMAYEKGDLKRAMFHYEQALAMDAAFPEAPRIGLAQVLQFLPSRTYRSPIEHLLLQCFASDAVGYQKLAALGAEQIRYKYPEIFATDAPASGTATPDAFLKDKLLLALLSKTINIDPKLERGLTCLRRHFFLAGDTGGDMASGARPFLSALGEQGWNNAYAFLVTPEEETRLAALKGEIETGLALAGELKKDDAFCRKLLLFSLYAPLHCLAGIDRCKAVPLADWPDFLQPIVQRTLLDWLEEQAIKEKLATLTPIEDAISRAVRSLYEEHPYPRWFSADRPQATIPAKSPNDGDAPGEILVAGCGSGQQAILRALRHPHVPITAVDLSRTSLAYGVRMAHRLGVENIDFLQADLLKLDVLKKQFPLIECGGVLHHMADPVAGWSVLTDLLRPGGRMFIALYSARARTDIVAARKWIADLGLQPTPKDMRALRKRLFFDGDATGLPDFETFKRCKDLFDLNGCRDLLFHVEEHHFTLPQIEKILDQLGLRFAGFHLEDPSMGPAYATQYPEDPDMTSLGNWDRFEATHPNAFINMYQFWCEKPVAT